MVEVGILSDFYADRCSIRTSHSAHESERDVGVRKQIEGSQDLDRTNRPKLGLIVHLVWFVNRLIGYFALVNVASDDRGKTRHHRAVDHKSEGDR